MLNKRRSGAGAGVSICWMDVLRSSRVTHCVALLRKVIRFGLRERAMLVEGIKLVQGREVPAMRVPVSWGVSAGN